MLFQQSLYFLLLIHRIFNLLVSTLFLHALQYYCIKGALLRPKNGYLVWSRGAPSAPYVRATRARSAGAEYSISCRVATVQSAERVARRQLPVPSSHGSKDYIDWSLSSSSNKIIEVALNKILRKVWNLPRHSHTAIVHCVALVPTVCV